LALETKSRYHSVTPKNHDASNYRQQKSAITNRLGAERRIMCRNIKMLFNFEPPATHQEIHAAATQFVRKVSGSTTPSQANRAAFDKATNEISSIVTELLETLVTRADPRDRAVEAEKARARSEKRFADIGHS